MAKGEPLPSWRRAEGHTRIDCRSSDRRCVGGLQSRLDRGSARYKAASGLIDVLQPSSSADTSTDSHSLSPGAPIDLAAALRCWDRLVSNKRSLNSYASVILPFLILSMSRCQPLVLNVTWMLAADLHLQSLSCSPTGMNYFAKFSSPTTLQHIQLRMRLVPRPPVHSAAALRS